MSRRRAGSGDDRSVRTWVVPVVVAISVAVLVAVAVIAVASGQRFF
ncbi:hypothetical protein [Frigoribacterium sp. PhB24]|nr:hypothetical protein [Frigoribacterium sp. PhB24]ROS48574.1 hypothetical protein EDF50_3073 [Frigoribacterium sp. PhB24]